MPDLNANSAMSANSVGIPMSYEDWYKSNVSPDPDHGDLGYGAAGDIQNFFAGTRDRYRDQYDLYKLQNDRAYELAKISDERAWNEYMQSSQYQRMSKDLEAAGLNPGVVLSGGIGASGIPSSSVSSGTNSSRKLARNDSASEFGGVLGRLASSALMAIAIVASKGMAAAGKAAQTAGQAAKIAAGKAAAANSAVLITKAAKQAVKSQNLKADLDAALSQL